MKPSHLKAPFSFENRYACLSDHIFYLPLFYQDYSSFVLPPFSTYFGNEHPIHVEYCSGNGDWIVEKAKQQPHSNWIAVEKRFDRVRKIWSKLKNHQLRNLLIVSGEALTFTQNYLSENSIEAAFINFPDPWPKQKHAKHRLLQTAFVDQLARVLVAGKKMTLVTDDPLYTEQAAALLASHSAFKPVFPHPYFLVNLVDYGSSWFGKLLKEQGKQIHYVEFAKATS